MQKSRAGLFLMELTIALLFFAISAAVCLQLFAKSRTMSRENDTANGAHIIAVNLADSYLAGEFDCDTTNQTLYYSESLTALDSDSSSFYKVVLSEHEGTLDIDVQTTEDSVSYYSLSVYKFIPEEVAS